MSKIVQIFPKTFFIEEYQFRTPTFVKKHFRKTLFLKSCPIFDEPSFINGIKKKSFKYVDSWPEIWLFMTHHL
jgi:hypothetical protein